MSVSLTHTHALYHSMLGRANPTFFLWAGCPADGACVNAAIYAVAGAFAVLTGVTRATRTPSTSPRTCTQRVVRREADTDTESETL
jgi:hypothetical protein